MASRKLGRDTEKLCREIALRRQPRSSFERAVDDHGFDALHDDIGKFGLLYALESHRKPVTGYSLVVIRQWYFE